MPIRSPSSAVRLDSVLSLARLLVLLIGGAALLVSSTAWNMPAIGLNDALLMCLELSR